MQSCGGPQVKTGAGLGWQWEMHGPCQAMVTLCKGRFGGPVQRVTDVHPRVVSSSISGLVAEYIVAIDVTRVRFPADALPFLHRSSLRIYDVALQSNSSDSQSRISLRCMSARSVAASYKPPMLVTRVRLPACAFSAWVLTFLGPEATQTSPSTPSTSSDFRSRRNLAARDLQCQ